MEKAINAYNTVTVSPEFKELERLRSFARHNETSALRYERDEGRMEGKLEGKLEIIKLLKSGKSAEELISEYDNK